MSLHRHIYMLARNYPIPDVLLHPRRVICFLAPATKTDGFVRRSAAKRLITFNFWMSHTRGLLAVCFKFLNDSGHFLVAQMWRFTEL